MIWVYSSDRFRALGLSDEGIEVVTSSRNHWFHVERQCVKSRPCECRKLKLIKSRLSAKPEKYREVALETLTPIASQHPSQPKIVEHLKANPLDSYGFAGTFGAGKTHFFWALYDNAARDIERRVWGGTLDDLLTDHKLSIQASQDGKYRPAQLTIEDLKQNHTKWSIFLDDIDKIKPTEYAGVMFFQILEAAVSYKHQLVWTSNLNTTRMRDFFDRVDEAYGGAILRRLMEDSTYVEMF